MAASSINPTLGKGGIYEWSAGAKFSTMLGGSASATVGTKTDLTVALANSFSLGASNSFKCTYDVGLTFGKSYSYKAADDVGFSKSSISIQEYGGARCLDLFQASAGLGPISRGSFQAQRTAVDRAIKVLIAVDVLAAVATINIAGFGAGFNSKASSQTNVATIASTLSSVAVVTSVISILLTEYLSRQRGSTKPDTWQPTAVLQASSQNGVLIANHQGLPDTVYSSFKQNDEGSVLRVSRGGQPEYSFSLIPDLDALDQRDIESLGEMGGIPAPQESKLSMTEHEVSLSSQEVSFKGNSTPVAPLPDSKMTATFQDIELVSTELSADGPSAQLQLNGSSQMASLVAQTAPGTGSSVEATPETLILSSGDTSVVQLGPADVSVSSVSVSVSADASAEVSAPEVSITGDATVSISAGLVRIG